MTLRQGLGIAVAAGLLWTLAVFLAALGWQACAPVH